MDHERIQGSRRRTCVSSVPTHVTTAFSELSKHCSFRFPFDTARPCLGRMLLVLRELRRSVVVCFRSRILSRITGSSVEPD